MYKEILKYVFSFQIRFIRVEILSSSFIGTGINMPLGQTALRQPLVVDFVCIYLAAQDRRQSTTLDAITVKDIGNIAVA